MSSAEYYEEGISDDSPLYDNNTTLIKCKEDGPKYFGCPIAPVMGGKLNRSLHVDGRQIFNEGKDYYLEESCYDGDMIQDIDGEDGYVAQLVHTKIPSAATAKVMMFLRGSPPDCGEKAYKVHLTVKINNVECFQKDSLDAVDMEYGVYDSFPQSRHVFAVPMDSEIKVEYELYHGDTKFAKGTYPLAFPQRTVYQLYSYLWSAEEGLDKTMFEAENYCFGMLVNWSLHENIFYKRSPWSWFLDPDYVKWNPHTQVLFTFEPPAACSLVEVFSVVLFSGNVSALLPDLCGEIVIRNDGDEKVYIFSRNENCPDMLSSNKEQQFGVVSVTWPDDDRWLLGEDFAMFLTYGCTRQFFIGA